jgi:RHS repeat-associated protein
MSLTSWLRTGSNKHNPARPRGRLRLVLELLEDRLVPAVLWDGGPTGTGTSWHDAVNWQGDALPAAQDDAEIGGAFSGITITSSADVTIKSLTSAAALQITGGTFSIAAASSITNAFTLSGGTFTGAGDLTINGSLTWTLGTMAGSGKTVLATGGTGTLASGFFKTLGRTLENRGTLSYTGTGLFFGAVPGEPALLDNLGTLNLSGDGDLRHNFSNASYSVRNAGTLNRSGAGDTDFVALVALQNDGTVNLQQGLLRLGAAAGHTGDFHLTVGATLELAASQTFAAGADITGNGNLRVTGGSSTYAGALNSTGSAAFDGGMLTVAGPVTVSALTFGVPDGTAVLNGATTASSLTMSAGWLDGAGQVTVTGTLNWTLGTMAGSGKTVLATGASGTLASDFPKTLGRTLENRGTLSYTGSGLRFGAVPGEAAVLDNLGTLNLSGDGDLRHNSSGASYTVRNAGILNRSGAGDTDFVAVALQNNGTVNLHQGLLRLGAAASHTGDFHLTAGATLELAASQTFAAGADITGNGNLRVTAGSSTYAGALNSTGSAAFDGGVLTVAGPVTVSALTFGVPDGTAVLNGATTASSLTMSAGWLDGAGQVTVTGTLNWTLGTMAGSGKTVLATGASGTLASDFPKTLGRTLENRGTLSYTGSGLRFGATPGEAAVLDNLGTLNLSGDGDLRHNSSGANYTVRNAGTLNRSGPGNSHFVAVALDNSGTINIAEGEVWTAGGGAVAFNGPAHLVTELGSTIRWPSSLTGTTTNADKFSSAGTVVFSGGSAAAPLLLEVMGRDLGAVSNGFNRNFAHGTLQLDFGYVKLVDAADNRAGPGAEALYVDTLIVPAGSTLDLNQLKLYARVTQIAGAVLGGTIQTVVDGGPIPLNTPTTGTITVAGEVDEWTFFGRAGQGVTLLADPGSAASARPISPFLGHVEVDLLHPNGSVLASGSSTAAGQIVALRGIELPVDGTYRLRVKAPPGQASTTGNYLLSLYHATVDVRPLVFNQQQVGVIETPYSVDRWTFAASANQQVRFDLINTASAAIRFKLTGPNGWAGFSDLSADSDPITLPSAGAYMLDVYSGGAGSGGYAFRLDEMSPTTLTLGTPFTGTLTGSGYARLFKVEVPQGNPLQISFDDATNTDRTEIYVRLGAPPTRRQHDYRSEQPGAHHLLLVPLAAPGTWYLLVYGESVAAASNFTLRAASAPVLLDEVTPDRHAANSTATLTLRGAGFVPGTQVRLVAAGGTTYGAQSVGVDAFDRLTAVFDLAAVPVGSYGVRVTLPGGATATLAGAFQVLAAGQAKLETRLILPAALGRHATATLHVEYANTGTAAMAAPILVLQSGDPDDSDRPLLTLDRSRLVEGFWTSAIPDGFATSVQIYASGATPGLLQPGETIRVPVYYAGLQQPWDLGDSQVEFEIRIHEAGNTSPINWASLQSSLRPSWMAEEAWGAVFANLTAQIGPTWGDYVRMLSDNAAYLGRLGLHVTDVDELYGFELQQAIGLSPLSVLATALDAVLPTPGLPLLFGRSFGNTITERYQVGPFGRGWAASWQVRLERLADGTVIVHESADAQRRFQPDSRTAGAYFSQTGDTGKLRQVGGGAYELAEANGLMTRFAADGKLDSIQDINGNRITAGYTGGRLTVLTHSSGASLTIAYNPAGRIERITDSAGRATTYTYDAGNSHLMSVTGVDGTTTYSYSIGNGAAREHALLSVTDPSGVKRFFEYDARGRLTATHLTGDVERVTYGYDSAGRVTATDAAGVTGAMFFDHRGLLVRGEDALGSYTLYQYNDALQLIRETDTLGRSRSYTWCGCGALKTLTDEFGRTTTFSPGGPHHQPTAFADARGNLTRYGYDAAGNRTGTTYPDGSVERLVYDALGNPTSLINRRGQPIALTYNAAGQVTQEKFPDGSAETISYDGRGRPETVVSPQGTTRFAYDSADRLTRVTYPNGRFLEYAYDADGRRTRMTDHTGFVVKYTYDPAGRLSGLRDAQDRVIVTYTYDAAGRLQREDKGNGTYTLYTYDGAGRERTITHHKPDNSVNARFEYGYDALGRRSGMTTLDGQWTYTYDLAGQLTRAVFASTNGGIPSQDLTYEYDALGNRVRTVINGVTTAYAANALNQYTSAGAIAFGYDPDGNLISRTDGGVTTSYSYDVLNRLVGVTKPGDTWAYQYDVLGNRSATVHNGQRTAYLVDPFGLGDVVAEYSGSGALIARYTHGLGLTSRTDAGGAAAFYDFDVLGSTAGLSGPDGAYRNRYSYLPYGESLAASETVANPFTFVGAFGVMREGNGLDFMRARFYAPAEGRFLSPDPIDLAGGQINLYGYVAQDPVNLIDPQGTQTWAPKRPPRPPYPYPTEDDWDQILGRPRPPSYPYPTEDDWDQILRRPRPPSYPYPTEDDWDQILRRPRPPSYPYPTEDDWDQILRRPRPPSYPYPTEDDWDQILQRPPAPKPTPPGGGGSSGGAGTSGSFDPNEKLGAAGLGPQAFIAARTVIPYRIDFENLGPGTVPTPARPATAPAQRVEITDQLSAHLDWSTLRFTEAGFGDTILPVPHGRQQHFAAVPMTLGGKTFDVEVELSFDSAAGRVRAVFQSLDPQTSLPPDVLTGFLPPEDGSGRGKGFIGFTVQPKAGRPTGTQLRNVALIRFDGQDIIATNQVDPQDPGKGTDPKKEALNTIDAAAPTSSVQPLPAVTDTLSFTVRWSGADDAGGSGVAFYDVFVSDNGGAFSPWLRGSTQTSAVFTGVSGHSYGFYSVAADRVGLRQATPTAAQATTLVKTTPPPAPAGIGGFDPATATFHLRNALSAGPDDFTFRFGVAGWRPLVGDWDGNGTDTIGVFNPQTATFYLRNANDNNGPPHAVVTFGGSGWVPLAGDWDGNGTDTIGAFDPATSTFYLRNQNSNDGPVHHVVQFGGSGWVPLVGDWNGDGKDGIGGYDTVSGTFYLRDARDNAGPPEHVFRFGGSGWWPLAGDWNGDGKDTIGAVSPPRVVFSRPDGAAGAGRLDFVPGTVHLRNANNNDGPPDGGVFPMANATWIPLVGSWHGPAQPLRAGSARAQADHPLTTLTSAELAPFVSFSLGLFQRAGLETDALVPLQAVRFTVADLPDDLLALAYDDWILVDEDAAGHGWFLDPTPETDDDLDPSKIDLVTVLAHEMGHLLGLDHTESDGWMAPLLAPGTRRLP